MHPAQELGFAPFGAGDPLDEYTRTRQGQYVRRYLDDLGARSILIEPTYFDRDYLAEFAAFYCSSSAGYPNICRRFHFFRVVVDRALFARAITGDDAAVSSLRDNYLGFVVIRPIPASPFGRTVLAWYEDPRKDTTPRIVEPWRAYHCHVAGLKLTVRGLAWQQQDSAVGTCATISLWSMLHSSALNGEHGLPTTASVTRAAHKTASLGQRVFPSAGLGLHHLCEAIKDYGLQPIVVAGDIRDGNVSVGFSRKRFTASCTSLLRSGYPVLVLGPLLTRGPHAVCAVGFRSAMPPTVQQGAVLEHDVDVPVLYLHDDNIGPSVRFRILEDPKNNNVVVLKAEAPTSGTPSRYPDPTVDYDPIVPTTLVTAVPEDIRTSPDALHVLALRAAATLSGLIDAVGKKNGVSFNGLTFSTRFSRLRDYLERDLAQALGTNPDRLGRARLELVERVVPMSLHLGVIRVGDGSTPLFDVLYDTTDNDRHQRVFAHVVFAPGIGPLLAAMSTAGVANLGTQIDAST